jgi:hypothetical protein
MRPARASTFAARRMQTLSLWVGSVTESSIIALVVTARPSSVTRITARCQGPGPPLLHPPAHYRLHGNLVSAAARQRATTTVPVARSCTSAIGTGLGVVEAGRAAWRVDRAVSVHEGKLDTNMAIDLRCSVRGGPLQYPGSCRGDPSTARKPARIAGRPVYC